MATTGKPEYSHLGDAAYRLRLAGHSIVAVCRAKPDATHNWSVYPCQGPATCAVAWLFHIHAAGNGDTRHAWPFRQGASGRPADLDYLSRFPARSNTANHFGIAWTWIHTA